MSYGNLLKTLLVIFFSASSTVASHAQFLTTKPYIGNKFDLHEDNYKFLVNAKVKRYDDKLYLTWLVANDSLEGYFAVYKSKGYSGPFVNLEFIYYSKGITKNTPIMFSCVDSSMDAEFNIYYIVKLDRNSLVIPLENKIWQSSIATFIIPEKDFNSQPVKKEEMVSDLYSQGF